MDEINQIVKLAWDEEKKRPEKLYEEEISSSACITCPGHMQLVRQINKVLEEMRKDPGLEKNEEIPININRLNFLYYTIKTRTEDGGSKVQPL